jgi:tRNA pseudouridine55 synthase
LRRILGTRRIGHTGTLDPFATGVLVACVGVATRLVQFLVGLDKEYIATVRLGFATDTQDLTGSPITEFQSPRNITAEQVQEVLAQFIGEQMQLPPMFSAKKMGGERLYEAARQGREIERQPVPITIYALDLLPDDLLKENADGTRDFQIRVRCSSGTYIRTLAHDIGAKLRVGAHLAVLHRTAVGQFTIEQALSLEEVEAKKAAGTIEDSFVSLSASIRHLPRLVLTADEIQHITHGRAIRVAEQAIDSQQMIRLCDARDSLIALGEYDAARHLIKPRVVFITQSA